MTPALCLLLVLFLLMSPAARAGTLAQFRTVFGTIDVELFDQERPVTVRNFIRYVQSGRYQNGIAHRLDQAFVLQGGGFAIANRGQTNWDVVAIPTFPPITNEFGGGPKISNTYGTIAMAKTSDPNSATAQFFFNLANNAASLDNTNNSGGFTVFGRVVAGTNILNVFRNFTYWTGTQTSNIVLYQYYAPPFNELPLLRPALFDTNLIYLDVSLLGVEVAATANGSREISWNSVSNRVNYVEFTTNFPPIWQPFVATNGNGARLKIFDSSFANRSRFYRVRVAY